MPVVEAPTVNPRTTNWALVSWHTSTSFVGAMARIENPVPSWIRKNRNVRTNVVVHIARSLQQASANQSGQVRRPDSGRCAIVDPPRTFGILQGIHVGLVNVAQSR